MVIARSLRLPPATAEQHPAGDPCSEEQGQRSWFGGSCRRLHQAGIELHAVSGEARGSADKTNGEI
jgi:hypothetical protein